MTTHDSQGRASSLEAASPAAEHEISRRRFLRRIYESSLGGGALIALGTGPAWSWVYGDRYDDEDGIYARYQYRRAFGNEPKFVAGYMDVPNGWQHCGICVHFIPPNGCAIVRPPVSPHGWCRHFEPHRRRGYWRY